MSQPFKDWKGNVPARLCLSRTNTDKAVLLFGSVSAEQRLKSQCTANSSTNSMKNMKLPNLLSCPLVSVSTDDSIRSTFTSLECRRFSCIMCPVSFYSRSVVANRWPYAILPLGMFGQTLICRGDDMCWWVTYRQTSRRLPRQGRCFNVEVAKPP